MVWEYIEGWFYLVLDTFVNPGDRELSDFLCRDRGVLMSFGSSHRVGEIVEDRGNRCKQLSEIRIFMVQKFTPIDDCIGLCLRSIACWYFVVNYILHTWREDDSCTGLLQHWLQLITQPLKLEIFFTNFSLKRLARLWIKMPSMGLKGKKVHTTIWWPRNMLREVRVLTYGEVPLLGEKGWTNSTTFVGGALCEALNLNEILAPNSTLFL